MVQKGLEGKKNPPRKMVIKGKTTEKKVRTQKNSSAVGFSTIF